ncbi:MAG: VWA domain-containing protein [Acidobacteriota bacterium]
MAGRRLLKLFGSLLLLPTIFLIGAAGQSASMPDSETIRLDTSLVVFDAQVINRRTGEFVNGLRANDFILRDDGAAQEISHFSQDRLNLSVILLLDLSGSVSPVLQEIRLGALGALSRLKQADEVSLMVFSSQTELVQDFTRDRKLIVDRIGEIEKTPVIGQGTSLFQALSNAASHMGQKAGGSSRRVIIVITDNVAWDYNSAGLGEPEVARQILSSGSMVCGLVVEGSLTRTEKLFRRDRDGRDIYRRRMTIDPFIDLTGGEMVRANPAAISNQLARLVEHLRSRYSFGYTPKREGNAAGYHEIRLELTEQAARRLGEVMVRTRRGYRVGNQ